MAQMVYRRHRDADAKPAKPILRIGIGMFVRPHGKDDSVSRFVSADMFSGIEVAMDPVCQMVCEANSHSLPPPGLLRKLKN